MNRNEPHPSARQQLQLRLDSYETTAADRTFFLDITYCDIYT
jgi:hypothetical protein